MINVVIKGVLPIETVGQKSEFCFSNVQTHQTVITDYITVGGAMSPRLVEKEK